MDYKLNLKNLSKRKKSAVIDKLFVDLGLHDISEIDIYRYKLHPYIYIYYENGDIPNIYYGNDILFFNSCSNKEIGLDELDCIINKDTDILIYE